MLDCFVLPEKSFKDENTDGSPRTLEMVGALLVEQSF